MTATLERRTACLRLVARDGTTVRTALQYPHNLVMSNGELYRSADSLGATGVSANTEGSPTVIDVGSVYSADAVTRDEVHSGKWDGARVYLFYTDWAAPVEDEEPDRVYHVGKVREEDDRYTVELMSLLDLLNQTTGRVVTPGCGWVFTDSHLDGEVIATDRSRCGIDPVSMTESSEITSVTSATEFRASGLDGLFDADWFGAGELRFTSGDNAGLSYRYVSEYVADGTITLRSPFYYQPQVGDQFDIRAGCRKRFQEDCVGKFANGVNYGGFPHVPQRSTVQKFGGQ